MRFKHLFILVALFGLVFASIIYTRKIKRQRYFPDNCLEETIPPGQGLEKKLIFQVKKYHRGNYLLYLWKDQQWWHYRKLDAEQLKARKVRLIPCPGPVRD